MRLVLYNIRYATGTGWDYHVPVPFYGLLRKTSGHIRKISSFLSSLSPDIVGLVETDSGSFRQDGISQADEVAEAIGGKSVFACKYLDGSVASKAPVLKSQGNAAVSRLPILSSREHFLSRGFKRTLLEVEFEKFNFFLMHLSLGYETRKVQIGEIADVCASSGKPVVLAGDGNTFGGKRELAPLVKRAGLRDANGSALPTYPSGMPSLSLDVVMYSEGIRMERLEIRQVGLSDHLPVICDFSVM
jgi:endonuclease/exonuclease/phosphatase family metal-dependent hydrolase